MILLIKTGSINHRNTAYLGRNVGPRNKVAITAAGSMNADIAARSRLYKNAAIPHAYSHNNAPILKNRDITGILWISSSRDSHL